MVGAPQVNIGFLSHIPVNINDLDYFTYTTPYGSPTYNTITLFNLPPPLPTTVSDVYTIEDYTTVNNWSSPGKTFVGNYWSLKEVLPWEMNPLIKFINQEKRIR